jgi:hypothetical protein
VSAVPNLPLDEPDPFENIGKGRKASTYKGKSQARASEFAEDIKALREMKERTLERLEQRISDLEVEVDRLKQQVGGGPVAGNDLWE